MNKIVSSMGFLGKKVNDSVTGFTGIVTSVTFDLYGCIQVLVHPGLDEKGEIKRQEWFDTNRLIVIDNKPVMENPFLTFIDFKTMEYLEESQKKYNKGPAEKPPFTKG